MNWSLVKTMRLLTSGLVLDPIPRGAKITVRDGLSLNLHTSDNHHPFFHSHHRTHHHEGCASPRMALRCRACPILVLLTMVMMPPFSPICRLMSSSRPYRIVGLDLQEHRVVQGTALMVDPSPAEASSCTWLPPRFRPPRQSSQLPSASAQRSSLMIFSQ
jgi:hypothetical protein